MRLLGKLAIGGTAASLATAGCLVAAGVFATSATLVVADPLAPAVRAEGLTTFDSCDTLLDWYVQRGVKDVGPYGWGYGIYDGYDRFTVTHGELAMPQGLDDLAGSAKSLDSRAARTTGDTGSATGTNTQEAAVDESDVAKTNGTLVARIVGDERLVLVDVAHGEPTVTRRLHLPVDGFGSELLLLGDHVLISQQINPKGNGERPYDDYSLGGSLDRSLVGHRATGGTRLLDVDISDPAAPQLLSSTDYSGQLLSLRQYGDTVRMVTSTSRPELRWTYPHNGVSPKEATRKNRALVERTTIKDWLPTVGTGSAAAPLLDCDEVSHPDAWSGAGTVAVTSFDIDDPATRSSVAITADGQVVYSSVDRLYLAATEFDDRIYARADDVRVPGGAGSNRTDLYAFALDGLSTPYVGAGRVNGTVRDRWSLDEQDGKLRVAWTRTDRSGSTESALTIFTEEDGRLVPTGSVDGLGRNEDVQSVRWFDDLAIVVTYRQIDPLYTIDLTDPAHPKKLGALKLPGYSGYLHPVGDDQLLGLGMVSDARGYSSSQAAVFDIADLTDPRRVSQHDFGRETGISALDDPRSFTWLPESRTAVTTVTDWMTGDAKLVALEVGPKGGLDVRTVAGLNKDYQARTLALPGGRIAILDSHRLRVVTVD